MTDIRMLLDVTTTAADVLMTESRRTAAGAYLQQRGIAADALSAEWSVGYAPPGWTRLIDILQHDFPDEALLDAGLAPRSTRGSLIDAFRNRIVFGVHDDAGTLVGFIGRDLSGDARAPKYLNSTRTELFDKSSLLFGLWEGAQVGMHRQPVLVEGPLDVLAIAAQDRGRSFLPIATCGTAFTKHQAQHVIALTHMHGAGGVVAMDADAAGRTAAINAGEQLHLAGTQEVRIAILPNGTDLAEHLGARDGSVEDFRIDRAAPLITVQVERAIAGEHDRMQWIEGRLTAARSIACTLTTYPPQFAARQIAWIAEALHLDASTVSTEVVDAYRRAASNQAHAPCTFRDASGIAL